MKKKIKIPEELGGVHDKAWERILFWQRCLADYLNAKFRNLSTKATLVLLIIFSVLTIVALMRLIINAIH
ncbi:MAG: hypothetical protein EOO88_38280 [Pedobacter sp.]|nr:MAG: hypothetical protein EOO88_38280 [Pedobacter sp.]